MKDIWQSIISKLQQIAPEIIEKLNPGASAEELSNLENIINAKLPTDFKDFYRIHNGQAQDSANLMAGEELLSITRIIDEWTVWKNLYDQGTFAGDNGTPYTSTADKGIKNIWWHPLWIPITYDGFGNHYCLDLTPTEEGNYGQVIRMWHDDPTRTLVAPSFKYWITEYKDKLVNGQLIYSEDYFAIVDIGDI